MRALLKVFMVLGIIILALIVLVVAFLFWGSKQPSVKHDYYKTVDAKMALEQKYTALGTYEVEFTEFDSNETMYKEYKVWYPKGIADGTEKYPIVVMANGTGVPHYKYEAIFNHLASWGFVVIGNDVENSWNGTSSSKSLDLLLSLNSDPNSIFYGKLDESNIGVAGHSQGGVGAINAVTNQENGNKYTAMFTASTAHLALANGLKWPYDASKINIPYFMVAGTLKTDAGNGADFAGIAPLWSLQENYDAIPETIAKVMARRMNSDHGEVLYTADGYMTAWFMYYLKQDSEAGKVFFGENPEILQNTENWCDVKIVE